MKDYARRIEKLQTRLNEYREAESRILLTGQSFRIRNGEDNRELTYGSLAQIREEISLLESQIEQLERLSMGGSPNGVRVRAR